MKRNCMYYWNKIAINHFANLTQEKRMKLAEKYLTEDELLHLKRIQGE